MTRILLTIVILLIASTAFADVNVLFTIDRKPVPQAVRDKLQEHGCEWVMEAV